MRICLQSDVSPDKIMRNRGLGDNGAVAKEMANKVKELCDNYVPSQQGYIRNNVKIAGGGKHLIYPGPYSHYQHAGWVMVGSAPKHYNGKALSYHDAPMRGDHWEKRMMADRREELERYIENYIRSLAK